MVDNLQTLPSTAILVLGGYGNFGRRVARLLAKDLLWEIWIGGRSLEAARALIKTLSEDFPHTKFHALQIDVKDSQFKHKLEQCGAKIVIHTAGPFQQQNYAVVNACLDLGIHYIDLADGRDYVIGIKDFDEKAKEKQVAIISGASSVPGLSSVVIDNYIHEFGLLREIYYGIAPGNRIERGEGTIAAILSYTGRPFQRLEKGKWKTVYGWQDVHRHYYGDTIGKRWHANIDIPDLSLFPDRYPELKSVVFHAGLELSFLHLILWKMSWLARIRLIHNWRPFAKPISAISRWFARFGSDISGMHMELTGSNLQYQPLEINWYLVAGSGHGLFVPAAPSVIVARKIREGIIKPGAQPCLGMFTLAEFDQMIEGLDIYHILEEKVM